MRMIAAAYKLLTVHSIFKRHCAHNLLMLFLSLSPVTVLTNALLVATIDLPGSMMSVRPLAFTMSRTVSIRSVGLGRMSPLYHQHMQHNHLVPDVATSRRSRHTQTPTSASQAIKKEVSPSRRHMPANFRPNLQQHVLPLSPSVPVFCTNSLVVVINAQASTDVEVLQLESLCIDHLDEVCHDDSSILEDVDLGDGAAQVTVDTNKLNQGLRLDGI